MNVSTILDALKPIADAYKASGVVHKYKAYRTCMDELKNRYGDAGTVTNIDELEGIKGVGKAMKEKIAELLKTGNLQQSANVRQDPVLQALELFTSVHGVGPVLANKLVREQGLRTIADLRNKIDTLPAVVQLGLKYFEDTCEKIPFSEVEDIVDQITKIVAKDVDPRLHAVCCGSHRRMVPASGDVDILVTHPLSHSSQQYAYLGKVVKALQNSGIVLQEELASGQTKFMGFARLLTNNNNNNNAKTRVRRIDIRWFAADQFFAALMYFTGSAQFNIRCRVVAQEKGLTLNEFGLWKSAPVRRERQQQGEGDENNEGNNSNSGMATTTTKELVLIPKCEADLFAALGINYLKPQDRTH